MINVSDDFEMSFNTANTNVIKMTPKKSKNNREGKIEIKAILAISREYERFGNFGELIHHLFCKQHSLRAKATRFQVSIGGKTISQYEQELGGDLYFLEAEFTTQVGMDVVIQDKGSNIFEEELIITPPRFGPPTSYIMETTGNAKGIPLLLGLEDIDESDEYITYSLSNREQDFPLKIKFRLKLSKHVALGEDVPVELNYGFTLTEDANKYHKILTSRLLLAMKETQMFMLREPATGKLICRGQGIKLQQKDCDYFRFWSLIGDIEDAFGIDLILPENLSRQDWKVLYDLSEILKNGKTVEKFTDITATMNYAGGVANVIRYSTSDSLTITARHSSVIELLGKKIDLGERVIFTPPLKLINREELEKKIKHLKQDEEICVKFAPLYCDQEAVVVYPKFYGTSNEKEMIQKENFPARWTAKVKNPH